MNQVPGNKFACVMIVPGVIDQKQNKTKNKKTHTQRYAASYRRQKKYQ